MQHASKMIPLFICTPTGIQFETRSFTDASILDSFTRMFSVYSNVDRVNIGLKQSTAAAYTPVHIIFRITGSSRGHVITVQEIEFIKKKICQINRYVYQVFTKSFFLIHYPLSPLITAPHSILLHIIILSTMTQPSYFYLPYYISGGVHKIGIGRLCYNRILSALQLYYQGASSSSIIRIKFYSSLIIHLYLIS